VFSVAHAADGLVAVKSPYGAKATMGKREALVKQRCLNVFARIDHAAGAASGQIAPPYGSAHLRQSDTWAMLLTGLGMVGLSVRRRKTQQA
jgi:hypothetical protein